jgi:Bacterial Ig domain
MKKTIFHIASILTLTAALVACPPALDVTPPSISLSSNSNNVITAGTIKLTATATDEVGVTKVEFYDGVTKLGEDTTTPYEQSVDFTIANNGTKSYSAKAFDVANNSTSSDPATTVTVNIPDTTPPTVSLSSDVSSVTTASTIKLTATTTDNVGVTKVEFYEGTTKIGEDLSSPFEQSIDFLIANNGAKTYSAKAYDAANNATSSDPVGVVVNIAPGPDTVPPTVSLSSTSSTVIVAGSIKLTATASDNLGVSKVEFYDGTTKLGEDTSTPFEQTINFVRANNGSKSFTAKAFDAANNSASSDPVVVGVNIPEILPPNGTLASQGDFTAAIGGLGTRVQNFPTTAGQYYNDYLNELNLASLRIQTPGYVIQSLTQIAGASANLAKNAFNPIAMMKEISSMAANAQSMASSNRSPRANLINRLPVGNFDCTGTVIPCPSTTNTDGDMVVTWKTKLGKTAVATLDWDASSAGTASALTIITTNEFNGDTYQTEVPTKLIANVTIDGVVIANLTFEAQWENSSYDYGYSGSKAWAFSFTHLAVTGSLFSLDGTSKLIDITKLTYDYDSVTGIKTTGDISLKLNDPYHAKWNISIGGIEVNRAVQTQPQVGLGGIAPFAPINKSFKPQGASSFIVSLEIGSSLYVIDAKSADWTYQTVPYGATTLEWITSLDGVTGSAAFDGKLVTFAGKIDGTTINQTTDSNHNCIPFEKLNVTFSDGTVTLEQYLINNFPSAFPVRNCP